MPTVEKITINLIKELNIKWQVFEPSQHIRAFTAEIEQWTECGKDASSHFE